MGRDRTLDKGLSRAAEVSEQLWLGSPWTWGWLSHQFPCRDWGDGSRGFGMDSSMIQGTALEGKGDERLTHWMRTKAQQGRDSGNTPLWLLLEGWGVWSVRYRSGNDWCASERRNTHFWMTQSVILLPGAVLLPQTTVCVYAAHLYAEVILTATKRQRYTCNVFFPGWVIFSKAYIWGDYQHDYLMPEGVINSSPCTLPSFLDVCGTVSRIFYPGIKRVWNKESNQDIDWNLSVICTVNEMAVTPKWWPWHCLVSASDTSWEEKKCALSCKLRNLIETC